MNSLADAMENPAGILTTWLDAGVLGATAAMLAFLLWRVWLAYLGERAGHKAVQEARIEDAKRNEELNRALLERTITTINNVGGVVENNTEAIKMALTRGNP